MQATGRLSFTFMLWAGRLHGRLCFFSVTAMMPRAWDSWRSRFLERLNSFQQSTRQATGHLPYILQGKSRSLVQLNVAY